jgi:hypothetical protein
LAAAAPLARAAIAHHHPVRLASDRYAQLAATPSRDPLAHCALLDPTL